MIDRINNYNLDKYKEVTNLTKSAGGDTGFSLDMADDGGVIFEPSDKEEKNKKTEKIDTVTLELSGNSNVNKEREYNNSKISKAEKETIDVTPGIIEDIVRSVKSAVNKIKDFFNIIVNAFIPEDNQKNNIDEEIETADIQENAYTVEDISDILKSGDAEELRKVVTENGRKIPARSTTLSTLYDNRGRRMAMQVDKREEDLLNGENKPVEQFLKRI